jgi:CheY-like chemotaxis protein
MKIMVVDDSKLMRTFLRVHLMGAGHQVVEIDPLDTFEVLKSLRLERPDLLITDYEMPSCNGETLVRFVREDPVLKDTRILVVSAHSNSQLVTRLGRQRLCGYLVKPISPEALLRSVSGLEVLPGKILDQPTPASAAGAEGVPAAPPSTSAEAAEPQQGD